MKKYYDDFARTKSPKDYWGQIKRTVNGEPVSEDQIDLIVNTIKKNLRLKPTKLDNLLDLGCGNGALSFRLFDCLRYFYGVDYSEYLIEVAKRDFEKKPNYEFGNFEAQSFLLDCEDPLIYNKALCYGTFSYFNNAEALLKIISEKFININVLFIGNLPDLDRIDRFYKDQIPEKNELLNPDSALGIWRNKEEFSEIAKSTGWKCTFSQAPESFYASHYRYDVLLKR